MTIGIDASRAFVKQRTGIEEYSFRVIDEMRKILTTETVHLYIKPWQRELIPADFILPASWEIKEIPFHRLWTQLGLAWELLINPVQVLFVPAHTVPWIHPANTVVTIHGLEYEYCPESYSWLSIVSHRFFIKRSCRWAKKIIAVSSQTKADLIKLYSVPEKKIEVVYNGFDIIEPKKEDLQQAGPIQKILQEDFLLFVGRLEIRKNILGILKTFEILRKEHQYTGKLVLAGKSGHGYGEIKKAIKQSDFKNEIIQTGYISEKIKFLLLKKAQCFLFVSFREGFGIPILEAQAASVPVVTSNLGPMDEVCADARVLVDPQKPQEIAKKIFQIIEDTQLRKSIIEKGQENVKRFSWQKCASQIAKILLLY